MAQGVKTSALTKLGSKKKNINYNDCFACYVEVCLHNNEKHACSRCCSIFHKLSFAHFELCEWTVIELFPCNIPQQYCKYAISVFLIAVLRLCERVQAICHLSLPAHLWRLSLNLRAGFYHLLGYSSANKEKHTFIGRRANKCLRTPVQILVFILFCVAFLTNSKDHTKQLTSNISRSSLL